MEGVGIQFHNVALSPLEGDGFTLLHVYIFLTVDIVIYSVAVWYVENVFPGQYGLPRPWYFPFSASYWVDRPDTNETATLWDIHAKQKSGFEVMSEELAELKMEEVVITEPEPENLNIGVKIENLCKIYKQTQKLAVDHLCLNMYEGQITALLGHNGGGQIW